MQICPRCGSTRVRHGYGRERFGLRLIGVRELLCNQCNLSFTRFVLPGMMPKSSHHSKKRRNHEAKDVTPPASAQSTAVEWETSSPEKQAFQAMPAMRRQERSSFQQTRNTRARHLNFFTLSVSMPRLRQEVLRPAHCVRGSKTEPGGLIENAKRHLTRLISDRRFGSRWFFH